MSQSSNNITVNSGTMTATAFYESSDSRLKTITSRTTSSDGIDTITFYHDEDLSRERIGYVAQEVQNVLPNAVSTDENGFLKVDYKDVHSWKIMELMKRIEQLEAKLNAQ
jgi:hypothetical protein